MRTVTARQNEDGGRPVQTAPLRSRLGTSARSAFTLTELLVSIGILMGMMAMMAMVFTTATRASGQAQVSTALYPQVVREHLDIPEELTGVCGRGSGYGDPAFPANSIDTPRNPLAENVHFLED